MSTKDEYIKSTIRVGDLENHHFVVKDYQRGYKWTIQQVLDLLEDVNGFNPESDGFYCLQPLALMSLSQEEEKFEVIDGQQRLSTIYIILSIIDKPHFQLSYQTRPASERFLSSITGLKSENPVYCNFAAEDVILAAYKQISDLWKTYVKNIPENDNSDNYHFFMAYKTIEAWFAQKSKETVREFLSKLKHHTRFIWYVEKTEADAKEVFRTLNSGKIPLTNAELIKAYFINNLKDSNLDIQKLQQNELATEWDYIEKELHDPRFWYFLNNDIDKDRYETRIDFLFEILVEPPPKGSDKLYTYRKFTQSAKTGLDWNNVRLCFYQLHEWYEDNDYYHMIGYLIYTGIKTIRDIRTASGVGKKAFTQLLEGYIREQFSEWHKNTTNDGDKDYLGSLDYNDSKVQMKWTLLLYNIELARKSYAHYRFPFDKLKGQEWTLEHIHAQNADDLDHVTEIRSWVNCIDQLMAEVPCFEIGTGNKFDPSYKEEFAKVKEGLLKHEEKKVDKIDEDLKGHLSTFSQHVVKFFNLHSIHNMALLDGTTNSSFGKKPFKAKREALVEIDKKNWDHGEDEPKAFIPIGTKNVFLKYTSSNIAQMDLWGWKDREDYIIDIQKTLHPYLPDAGGAHE